MSQLQEIPLNIPPGVVKTDSRRVIEGRWQDLINMRFDNGRPQKIGGWIKGFVTATLGTPRTLHAWRDNNFNQYVACGTYVKLYVYDTALVQNDITPFRSTGTLGNNPFTTALGSPNVTVAHTAHGVEPGDIIHFAGSTAVGGITPNGTFSVQSIIDANTYTFAFTSNATSATTGGGNAVTFKYEISIGVEIGVFGYGYGVGGYGLGTFGTARTVSTIFIEPRVWSLDHFGQILLATYNGGAVYEFDPTATQPWGQASIVDASAPTNCRALFVTPERFPMALLSGMQVAWPSQGTITDWTPTLTNTANVRTLTEGTKLVAGRVLADFVSLVWTDAAVYLFQYTGSTFIYSSSMIAKDCGLIGPNAAVTVGGVGYWMGQDTFWNYNGTVTPMPNVNDIRKWLFDQIDINFGYTCVAIFNPKYNEVWFFVTIMGETNPTLGLIFSIAQQVWAPLYWGRCGGTHFTQGDTSPFMGDATTDLIMQHEKGFDADGLALPYSMTLSPYALSKGGKYNWGLEYMVSDFEEQTGDVTLTITTWDRLNDTLTLDTETETIPEMDSGTIDLRVSGRYIGWVVSANALGTYVRMGLPVVFGRTMGTKS